MSVMTAQALLQRLSALGVSPTGASADSRRIRPGDLFVAWPGFVCDGREHAVAAVERGAVAVIYDNADGYVMPELPVPAIGTGGLRDMAGLIADQIHGRPSSRLWVLGVTGTNGKTSVSQWFASALGGLAQRCGVIGTLGSGFPGQVGGDAINTTPDVLSLHALLKGFADQGATAVAMEVSSIGLEQGRINGVEFDVAVFTNLSHDHLDYHGDMESYGQAKARLFQVPGLGHAVINLDDEFGRRLIEGLRPELDCIAYTLHEPVANERFRVLRGELVASKVFGTHLRVFWQGQTGDVKARVLGRFNAQNLLAVVGALICKGVAFEEALVAVSALDAPPGRMQLLGGIGEPLVVVDYAHSPDALAKVLEACRETALSRGGRLICVFGCGGDRDRAKRPLMGEVACRLADRVLVTSDNPRSERPEDIIAEVMAGGGASALAIPDRAEAIAWAVRQAGANDVVVLAGKGHEPYQEIKGQRMPFSDPEHARQALCDWLKAQGGAA